LEALQKIRDCIVHAGGYVPESRDKSFLTHLHESHEGIEVGHDGFLEVTLRSHYDFAQATRSFFTTVFSAAGFGPSYVLFSSSEPPKD
jgi:hypothetical protein